MVGHVLIEIERAAEVGRAQRQKTYGVACHERRVVRCHPPLQSQFGSRWKQGSARMRCGVVVCAVA